MRTLRDEFLIFGSPMIGDREIAEVVATPRLPLGPQLTDRDQDDVMGALREVLAP